jgi:hypothetical protein
VVCRRPDRARPTDRFDDHQTDRKADSVEAVTVQRTEPSGLQRYVSVLEGIRPYQRSWLPTDIVAGITLAALAIPETMGYTKIAGMPVITGLYTILIPIIVFAFFGSGSPASGSPGSSRRRRNGSPWPPSAPCSLAGCSCWPEWPAWGFWPTSCRGQY